MYLLYPVDCISGASKYIQDSSVDLIITDPPYAIEGDRLHRHYHRNEDFVIEGYAEIQSHLYRQFSEIWIREAERILRPGGSIYIVSGYTNLVDIIGSLQVTALKPMNHIIWKYNFGVYTSKKFVTSHYHILYYSKPGAKPTFNTYARFGPAEKDRDGRSLNYSDREDVWIINRAYKPGQVKNKNELPRELLIKMMQYSSNRGDTVVDFFLGGFSTAEVAIGLDRNIIGFEINPVSFNHHLPRMKQLKPGFLLDDIRTGTGIQPVRQRKRWTEEEIDRLRMRFQQIFKETGQKLRTIEILQKEFNRGYFAILNQINRFLN